MAKFDPNAHMMKLRGKDYLEVKWRLVWFREERPDWGIETEVVQFTPERAVCRAVVKDEHDRVLATGTKTETPKGFADYLEKAETGAIGRALAVLGYGTQFAADELDEGSRIVDSPVERKPAINFDALTQAMEGLGVTQEQVRALASKPSTAMTQAEVDELTAKLIEQYGGAA